jgi:N6-L-threonylcarbamoyladenine synthase
MSRLTLGIDTSNYKTSVAVTDEMGKVNYQRSEFLKVEQGERGLRQSVAFFQHCQVLPTFIQEAMAQVNPRDIQAVAVSSRPRNIEGSYMPVFLSGLQTGTVIASTLNVPMYLFSHQEGHIEAILSSLPDVPDEQFLLFHLSGGTTECLLCRRTKEGYEEQIVGGTKDISIGQLLDRTGVQLGYSFPAGKYLDRIACEKEVSTLPTKVRITDGYFNLSGMETQVRKYVEKEGDTVVPGVFRRIEALLHETAIFLSDKYHVSTVIMAGGVSASETLRRYSNSWNPKRDQCRIYFGNPILSGDNAVGISLLGGRMLHESCKRNAN